MDEDMDEQEEGREMSESITDELREYAADNNYAWENAVCWFADRIDRELTAKQDEVDGLKSDNEALHAKIDRLEKLANKQTDTILKSEHRCRDLQARLDASIPLPVDANGVPWTCADVDKSFSLTDGDKATSGLVREIAYGWPRKGWFIVDQYDTHYPASKCHHGTPEPSEPNDSQERIDADVEKSACEYFGRSGKSCIGCPAEDVVYTLGDCLRKQMSDLLRRQRELDGAGEQR